MEELNSQLFMPLHATWYWLTMVWKGYDWTSHIHVMPQARLLNRALYAPSLL